MKKFILATLIAIGLVGCGSSSVEPRHVMLANLGCNTLGLQLNNVKEDISGGYGPIQKSVRVTAFCAQGVTIIIDYIPDVEQEAPPAKAPSKALKDA